MPLLHSDQTVTAIRLFYKSKMAKNQPPRAAIHGYGGGG